MQRHLPKADKGFHLRGLVHLTQPSRYLLKHCPPPMPGNRQRRRTDYQIPPDQAAMFRGSYTAGSVAFLLLSTTLPAFCLRIFPQNAGRRMVGRIALAPASCIQNRPGFHHGNRGGSFALGVLFQALTQNLARGLLVSPAYAGKRLPRVCAPSGREDHPRVCGEKQF